MPGLRFAGAATLHNVLDWPSGRFSEHRGEGHLVVTPPPGVTPMSASLAAARAADANHTRHEWGPFAPLPLPAHLPIAAELTYRYTPDEVIVEQGALRDRAHARHLQRDDGVRRVDRGCRFT